MEAPAVWGLRAAAFDRRIFPAPASAWRSSSASSSATAAAFGPKASACKAPRFISRSANSGTGVSPAGFVHGGEVDVQLRNRKYSLKGLSSVTRIAGSGLSRFSVGTSKDITLPKYSTGVELPAHCIKSFFALAGIRARSSSGSALFHRFHGTEHMHAATATDGKERTYGNEL